MISKVISVDILQFLLEKKGFTKESLSKSMDISIGHIDKILKNKALLDQKDLSNFSKSEKYKIWKLMLDAIPEGHLSKKAKEKIELCAILSKRLKNK